MTVALDTNILIYGEGLDGQDRRYAVRALIDRIPVDATSVSTQACAELYRALVSKFRWERARAHEAVQSWRRQSSTEAVTIEAFDEAMLLAKRHELQIFDAMILAAAVQARCSVLLSEDMQHGFTWRGCTIVNPFVEPPHPALAAELQLPTM